jgi:hypothetical protein
MSKSNLVVQNVIGNMALEGIELSSNTIKTIKTIANPNLSQQQRKNLTNKKIKEVINNYTK